MRVRSWTERPLSSLPLVVLRMGFGLLMFAGAVRFLSKGWVETQFLQPDFHFTYPYLNRYYFVFLIAFLLIF